MRTLVIMVVICKAPDVVATKRERWVTEDTRIVTGSLAERGTGLRRQYRKIEALLKL